MIKAEQRDFKYAFQKHLHAYLNWQNTGSEVSRRLILIYCVECGLKYKVMESQRIHRVNEAQPDVVDDLRSHNFYKLLKRLNQAGIYQFPKIQTVYGDQVDSETYHQLCRYSIRIIDNHQNRISSYDEQLIRIADWLRECV